jgi:hypothetical protein
MPTPAAEALLTPSPGNADGDAEPAALTKVVQRGALPCRLCR